MKRRRKKNLEKRKYTRAWFDGKDVCLSYWSGGKRMVERHPADWYFSLDLKELESIEGRTLDRLADRVEVDGRYARIYTWYYARDELLEWLRGIGVNPLEADVPPADRYVFDHGIDVSAEPKVLFFDLETDGAGGWEDVKKHRIISVAYGEMGGGVKCLVVDKATDEQEAKLLDRFLDVVAGYDVLAAWNGSFYDEPVLKARCAMYEMRPRWKMLGFLDHMDLFKRYYARDDEGAGVKVSYSLENIAQTVLGKGKLPDVPRHNLLHLLEGDRAKLVEYNRRDVELMLELEEKLRYVEAHAVLAQLCNRFLDDRALHAAHLVDGFVLRYAAKDLGGTVRFPTNWREHRDGKAGFEGAYVMAPVVGMHEQVCDLDFSSLYPSIVISLNIGPETKLGRDREPGGGVVVAENGVAFRAEPEGVFSAVSRRALKARAGWKKKARELEAEGKDGSLEHRIAKQRSDAWKVLANSLYGVVSSPFSRFADKECGEAITLTAKAVIKTVIKEAKKDGFRVVYGDSITEDRTVVLQKPNGAILIDSIGNVWRRFVRDCARGRKERGTLPGFKALARDKNGRVGWFPVRLIIRHKTKKEVWLVSMKRGQTEVTEDHGIVIGNDVYRPSEVIEKNLWFESLPALPPNHKGFGVLDLFQYLQDVEVTWDYKGRLVERYFNVDSESIVLTGWGKDRRMRRFYRRGSPEMMSLLRLIGAYVAEGSVTTPDSGNRWCLSISQNDVDWLNGIREDFATVFPGTYISRPFHTCGSYVLRAGSILPSIAMMGLCGMGSREKRLPEFVFELQKAEFAVLFEKLLEGDGSVKSNGVTYTTISQVLIAQLSYLLALQGLDHAIHYRESKGSWNIRLRPPNSERVRGRIKHTKRTSNGYVYDLEVEGAHTFVDGVGRVLLHNTDSVFIKSTKEVAEEFAEKRCAEVVDEYMAARGAKTGLVRLKVDAMFDRIFFLAKKRYAGRKDTGKWEIRGLELIRSDGCRYAREMQRRIITFLLESGTPRPQVAANIVKKWADKLFAGEVPVDDLMFAQSLSRKPEEYKTKPVHVRIAEKMLGDGKEVYVGMKIPYVLTGASGGRLEAVHVDDFDGKLNAALYWKRKVYLPTRRILDAVFPEQKDVWASLLNYEPARRQREMFERPEENVADPVLLKLGAPTTGQMEEVKGVVEKYPGKHEMKLEVDTGDSLVVLSTETRVRICPDLVKDVERIVGRRVYYGPENWDK